MAYLHVCNQTENEVKEIRRQGRAFRNIEAIGCTWGAWMLTQAISCNCCDDFYDIRITWTRRPGTALMPNVINGVQQRTWKRVRVYKQFTLAMKAGYLWWFIFQTRKRRND